MQLFYDLQKTVLKRIRQLNTKGLSFYIYKGQKLIKGHIRYNELALFFNVIDSRLRKFYTVKIFINGVHLDTMLLSDLSDKEQLIKCYKCGNFEHSNDCEFNININ